MLAGQRKYYDPEAGVGAPPPRDRSTPPAELFNHFSSMIMMIGLLEKLPDLAEDISQWRPSFAVESLGRPTPAGASSHLARPGPAFTAELGPIGQRAFAAVVAGLDCLGGAAARLCAANLRVGGDDIAACREIADQMRGLLERAMALLENGQPGGQEPAQRRIDRLIAGRDNAPAYDQGAN